MKNDLVIANRLNENPAVFDARFSRCYRLLYFLARRILGSPERAGDAVENCRLAVSRNPPRVEYEGEFRSWLLRVLMGQALTILRPNQRSAQNEIRLRRDSFGARNQLHEKRVVLLKPATKGSTENVCQVSNEEHGRT